VVSSPRDNRTFNIYTFTYNIYTFTYSTTTLACQVRFRLHVIAMATTAIISLRYPTSLTLPVVLILLTLVIMLTLLTLLILLTHTQKALPGDDVHERGGGRHTLGECQ
jgi:hypothetical protein